jgi:integrase
VKGRLKAIKKVLGDLPVGVLEKPRDVLLFKAIYRKGHEMATVNRALATLHAAINWGRFQDPPYLTTTPFHRIGVNIKVKEETKRDRRIGQQEEQALLAACSEINGAEHRYVGSPMHDRLIGAPETCSRQGEMLRIQNRHVDWEKHQIAIPGKHAKDRENRRIPFDPEGRLTPILKRRKSLGPSALCSARQREHTRTALRRLGSPCFSSRTATTRNARNPVLASIARGSGRSTCTGTTSVTRAPVASSAMEWTCARFN